MSNTPEGQAKFIKGLIKNGHHSVLEHGQLAFNLTTDRAVLAQITRHRIASFSVSSQRYNRYDDPNSFEVICPLNSITWPLYNDWIQAIQFLEEKYNHFLKAGVSPQIARGILPQCFVTRIRMTANIREWRHIFQLRISKAAYPPIRNLMRLALYLCINLFPVLFDDLDPLLGDLDS
jgi:thymidylate synthase (FAD)